MALYTAWSQRVLATGGRYGPRRHSLGRFSLTGPRSLLHIVVTASLWVLLYEGGRHPSPRLRALYGAGILHHTRAPGLPAPIYVSHPVWPTCVTYFLLLRPLARNLGVTFLGGDFGLSLLLFYPPPSIPLRAIPLKDTGRCFFFYIRVSKLRHCS